MRTRRETRHLTCALASIRHRFGFWFESLQPEEGNRKQQQPHAVPAQHVSGPVQLQVDALKSDQQRDHNNSDEQKTAQPWPFTREGDKVAIRQGPLRGIEGVVSRCKSGQRLILSVTMLQRSVSVEIDPSWVERIN